MVRPVTHSIFTPFWANWDQSNAYGIMYIETYTVCEVKQMI